MKALLSAQGRRDPLTVLAVGGAALMMGLVIYVIVMTDRPVPLNRSQVGFAGLAHWLKSQDIETLVFRGGGALRAEDFGLRILPLIDTDLASSAPPPMNEREDLDLSTENDITDFVVNRKRESIPTLVVLPKWRRAVRLKGVAHPDYLIPETEIARLISQVDGLGGTLVRTAPDYAEFPASHSATGVEFGLYLPQLLSGSGCDPIIGNDEAMLLGRCGGNGESDRFWLLADPDLLNNHGLTMSGNARLIREMIAGLAGDERVLIDLSTSTFIANSPEPNKRSWADIARFLTGAFVAGWLGLALLAALLIWRASVRYGPAIRLFEDRPVASKTSSINATARLLRISGHDLELLKSHIAARCRILAADLVGPKHGMGADPVGELAAIVSRRSPRLAEEISRTARDLNDAGKGWSDNEMLRFLDRFEGLYERTVHEFGRSADTRSIHPQ